jgi:hypothetical protein
MEEEKEDLVALERISQKASEAKNKKKIKMKKERND